MKLSIRFLLIFTILSQHLIGGMYEDGILAYKKKDYKTAYKDFKYSCEEENSSKACHELGGLYKDGYGVRKNLLLAIEYFQKSCEMGNKKGCKKYKNLEKLMPACSIEQLLFLEDQKYFKVGQKDGYPVIVADSKTIQIDTKKKVIKVWIYWIASKAEQQKFLKDFGKKYKKFGYFKRQMAIDYEKNKYKALRVKDLDVEGHVIMSFDFKGAPWKKIIPSGMIDQISKKIQKKFIDDSKSK